MKPVRWGLALLLCVLAIGSAQAQEKRIVVKAFWNPGGMTLPQGVDVSNNPMTNMIEDIANVDLQFDMPPYADAETKMNLMLASGNLPDIMFFQINSQVISAQSQGAFLDIRPYYDKSAIIQKWIPKSGMDRTKDTNGKNTYLPYSAASLPYGYGQIVRWDLVKKYNNGVWPTTVDEWANLLVKIKQDSPDSTPISPQRSVPLFNYAATFWDFFGVKPNGAGAFQIRGGQYVDDYTTPEFRAALLYWVDLYKKGVLDKEFATTTVNDWIKKFLGNNITMVSDSPDQLVGYTGYWMVQPQLKDAGARFMFAPPLKQYPAALRDTKYANKGRTGIGVLPGAGLFISATTPQPDRVWRVIEALGSDKVYDALIWGQEGKDYVVQNGQRVAKVNLQSDPNRRWYQIFMQVVGYTSALPVQDTLLPGQIGAADAKLTIDSRKAVEALANANGPAAFDLLRSQIPDTFFTELKAADDFKDAMVAKVVTGRATIQDYDSSIADYTRTYGDLAQTLTNLLVKNKASLIASGCKEASW